MSNKNKLKVGMTLFLKAIGNASVYVKETIECRVVSVGRKFFTIDRSPYLCGSRFFIETNNDDGGKYSSNYIAYFSREEIENEKKHNKLYSEIKDKYFSTYSNCDKVSLDKLIKIQEILNS